MNDTTGKEEQRNLIENFVEESHELLDAVGPLLIDMEREADLSGTPDRALLDEVFRLFHSMKGGAGYLGLTHMVRLTHAAETMLDRLRTKDLGFSAEIIDVLNLALDLLSQVLPAVEKDLTDEAAADHLNSLTDAIAEIVGDQNLTGKAQQARQESAEDGKAPFEFDPSQAEEFVGQANDLLSAAEENVKALDAQPQDAGGLIHDALRKVQTLAVTSSMFGFNDLATISGVVRDILAKAQAQGKTPSKELVALLLGSFGFQRKGLKALEKGREPSVPGTKGLLTMLIKAAGKEGFQVEAGGGAATKPKPDKAAAPKEPQDEASPSQPPVKQTISSLLEQQKNRLEELRRETDTHGEGADATVRISVAKLEEIMDLVEEIAITEAMLVENPYSQGEEASYHEFRKVLRRMEKLTHSLQDATTSLRMVPLKDTFRKMKRLVRDMSRQNDKKAELILKGEHTEIDKGLVNVIRDPLVHLLRNAIDHGLETTEQRRATGKPEKGRIELEARHVSSDVVIRVSDDGCGLDREKILDRARQQGILQGTGAEMKDREVWQLILAPGFSTSETVTEISGRGVGMDVVMDKLEMCHGRIEIQSKPGKGATFIMRVPLTLALLKGIVVKVKDKRFIIPFVGIRQTMKIRESQLSSNVDGLKLIKVRNRLIPLMRLSEMLDLGKDTTPWEEGFVVIIEDRDQRLGLFVHSVVGKLQLVVKGLSEYLGDSTFLAGTTIMGDGEVSPILNVPGIITRFMPDPEAVQL